MSGSGTKMKKIILENTTGNHSKYYEMEEQSNGEFIAKWGRISARSGFPAQKAYPMSDWDKVLNSKLKKGYSTKSTKKVRMKDVLDEQSFSLEFWNKIFSKMNTLLVLMEACKPNRDIDDIEIRWVEDRIEYFNAEERLLTKEEMLTANLYWKKYNGNINVIRS